MAEDLTLIGDLALVAVTAAVTAVLFHRLRLPLVLGYIAAGVLVGPHLFGFPLVQDAENISILAQIGVLFLLFALGLHFHLGELRKVGGVALSAGLLETLLMVGVGFLVASLFGWSRLDALFLGGILAISSTTLIVKVMTETGRLRAPSTKAIFGILLVEDLVAVLLIALLSSIALTGEISAITLGSLLVRVGIFVLASLVLGLVIVPRAVDYVARLRVEELLVLFAVGIAFGLAMLAVSLDLSLALGAFIAGAIVAESRASSTVERRIAPLRDVFTAVFFVSTGILLDPADVVAHWQPILILSAVLVLGKIAAVGLATFVAGYPPGQALRVGIGMAMIGEFSFVIATLGADLGVTSSFLFPIAVAVSAVTTLVTPPLIRNSDALVRVLRRFVPRATLDYLHMYAAWAERARQTPTREGGLDLGILLRGASYAALLVALAAGTRYAQIAAPRILGDSLALTLAIYTVGALLAIPVVVGLARTVRKIVDRLVYAAIPAYQAASGRGKAAAEVLRNTLYVFLAVLLAVLLLAAGAAFVPPLPLLLAAAVLVGAAAFLLQGSLRRLNRQFEAAVDAVFQEAPPDTRDQVLHLLRERYPWDVHVSSVILGANSRGANRRVRDLQLPQRTGASIVTHEREGRRTTNPAAELVLLPGDVVGVMGDETQVAAALALLTAEVPPSDRPGAGEDVTLEEMDVQEGSPVAGLTLAGSRIREVTGASVVGVRREGVPILNPAPVFRLQPGDQVLVLGSRRQLLAARAIVEGGPP